MKRTDTIQRFLLAALLATSATLACGAATTTNSAPAAPAIIRSVFTLPAGAKDGRDPFYPTTTRALGDANQAASAQAATNSAPTGQAVEIASLKFPGVSGTPGKLLAIINNHTFAVGDEGDVTTPNGKIHLRCLEIHPDVVVVEIAGKVHRINLEAQ